MFWVAWKGYNGGKAVSLGAVEQGEAEAYGMHGYPTAAQAQAKPNSVNAVEKTQVNAWIVAANDITGNPVADAEHGAAAAASGVLGTLAGFLGLPAGTTISGKNIAVRAAKMVTGIVMIIVGLVKLTGTDKAVTAAAKGAVL
jgi:hypothetical protein